MKKCGALICVAAIAIGVHLVLSQTTLSQTTLSDQAKQDLCAYLNTVRANFTICCKFPTIVMWRWQLNRCTQQCQTTSSAGDTCCAPLCHYRSFGVIPAANNTAQNATWNPTTGLIYAFMLSVGNASDWEPVITEACTYCFNTVIKQSQYDSCGIPVHLYNIINCAYNEIFFNCPPWNPFNLNECEFTKEYIDECFRI